MAYTDLDGKIAIVTGAAAGIGKALAEAFIAEGIRVAAMDIDQAGVLALQDKYGKDAVLDSRTAFARVFAALTGAADKSGLVGAITYSFDAPFAAP